jgi:hypothetical protein
MQHKRLPLKENRRTPSVALLSLVLLAEFFTSAGVVAKQNKTSGALSTQKTGSSASLKRKSVTGAGAAPKPMGDHYLLLVNTAIAFMMTPEKMAQFDKSPYDGIAVAFWHAYDTSPVISPEEMKAKIAEWKRATKKDIWPWVYVNRMIGADPNSTNAYTKDPYFHRFRGADLDGKAGAQKEFLENWQNSLRAAQDSGAPGIFCDLEFYNFYKEYDVGALALETGKKPTEVVNLLRQLGSQMANLAAQQFPHATLWFAFTGFTHAGYKLIDNQPYYPSPTYIAMGLLDEIKNEHLPLKVLAGGEGSLAYCHDSLDQFRDAIQDREAKFAPQLQTYRDALELAGTMTLYSDRSEMQDWVKKDCSASSAQKLEDLQPYLELLLKTYRYNWIYGSGDGGYLPFAPRTAGRFDTLIRKAEAHASETGWH